VSVTITVTASNEEIAARTINRIARKLARPFRK
jgi:hypothetical protein